MTLEHGWDLTPGEAVELQAELARMVREEPLPYPPKLVAGVDCAFLDDGARIVAAAVCCETRKWSVVGRAFDIRECTFPYVPGLLSFREAQAVTAAVKALPVHPDLLFCDGQGKAHPRRLGLACHVGLLLDLPTIGIGKSLLCGTYRMPGTRRGCRTRLVHRGEVVGAAVRTRTEVNPLFVSVGHRVTLPEAVRLAIRSARGVRLCEPTRQADRYAAQLKRTHSTPHPSHT